MATKLISVIIPVYKVEEYLDKCVESIVNQTYKNLEIILVDDGSPDNCPKMCDEWAKKDERIRVIHKENGGLSDARNAGVLVAEGEYIYFVDSDDAIIKEAVENAMNFSQNYNAQVVISTIKKKSNTQQVIVDKGYNIYKEILSSAHWEAWGKLIKTDLVKAIPFKKGRLYEDILFSPFVVLKAQNVVFVDDGAYLYTKREESIMGKSKQVIKEDLVTNINELLMQIKKDYRRLYSFSVLWGGRLLLVKKNSITPTQANEPFIDAVKKYFRKHFLRLFLFNKLGFHFRHSVLKTAR